MKSLQTILASVVVLRLVWLVLITYLCAELFFLNGTTPLSHKAYLVVVAAVTIIAGNMAYPYNSFTSLKPAVGFALWSLLLACSAGLTLLVHSATLSSQTPTYLALALAVFSLSFLLCCVRHLCTTISCKSPPIPATLTLLAILTTLPFWLAPVINLATMNQGLIDLILLANPMVYLAVMVDFDILRSDWFYEHTPYGAIQYHYPSKLSLTVYYAFSSLILFIIAQLGTRQRRHKRDSITSSLT
ncbi:MAG: hypothetical protein FD130_1440 [Halothiobacillaceae bacterium]|nr:MAG: hypothetical protein FD130_1440 [Halothiobacillaceae bacterium]